MFKSINLIMAQIKQPPPWRWLSVALVVSKIKIQIWVRSSNQLSRQRIRKDTTVNFQPGYLLIGYSKPICKKKYSKQNKWHKPREGEELTNAVSKSIRVTKSESTATTGVFNQTSKLFWFKTPSSCALYSNLSHKQQKVHHLKKSAVQKRCFHLFTPGVESDVQTVWLKTWR